ncbi:hypothetical protein HY441_01050 [Candidatus Microgenomates bacterium]|nr:hypothetical protein [Candidatus Microgenomates bacterium]
MKHRLWHRFKTILRPFSRSPSTTNVTGFTIVEIAVATAVVGLIVISLTNLFITIAGIQRQNNHLALASRSAEQKIESLRNNHYNSLPLSPPPIDFTNELPADLPTPRSATVTVSEPAQGMKRLDVAITYREGSRDKTIQMSALLGNIGISQ